MLKRLWPFIEMPLVYVFIHLVVIFIAWLMNLITFKWHPTLIVLVFALILCQYGTSIIIKRGFKALCDLIGRSVRTVDLEFVCQVEEHTGILSEKFVSFSSRETRREPVYIMVFTSHGEYVRFFTTKYFITEPGKQYSVKYAQRSKVVIDCDDLRFNRAF